MNSAPGRSVRGETSPLGLSLSLSSHLNSHQLKAEAQKPFQNLATSLLSSAMENNKTTPDLPAAPPSVKAPAPTPTIGHLAQSPRVFFSSLSDSSPRRVAIAVDLSDESAHAVRWAVQNYLRPGDAVVLLHVRPTSVLYGADWGSIDMSLSATDDATEESQQKLEDDFNAFTTIKAQDLAQPLVDANIPFKIHIVKDHDMKERLCLEVERLGLSAMIMGSRGFGASRRASKGRLGSVSDYCVHHCVCPVVVVRFPEDGSAGSIEVTNAKEKEPELHPVPEEPEYHDAAEEHKDV